MKRRLLIIALFLVAGTLANVAVALASAARFDKIRVAQIFDDYSLFYEIDKIDEVPEWWFAHRPEGFAGVPRMGATWSPIVGASVEFLSMSYLDYADDGDESGFILKTGWPMSAFQGTAWSEVPYGSWVFKGAICIGDHPLEDQTVAQIRILPIQPAWLGFLINTSLYGSVLWLLTCGPFTVRRILRVKRGLCFKCAYPVGPQERCTECGSKPISRRVREPSRASFARPNRRGAH